MNSHKAFASTSFCASHYENLPMQYMEIFSSVNIEISLEKKYIYIYNIFAQNIDCGYRLEPPNENPPSMFWIKNKKNMYTPHIKVGYEGGGVGYTLHGHIFLMATSATILSQKTMSDKSSPPLPSFKHTLQTYFSWLLWTIKLIVLAFHFKYPLAFLICPS